MFTFRCRQQILQICSRGKLTTPSRNLSWMRTHQVTLKPSRPPHIARRHSVRYNSAVASSRLEKEGISIALEDQEALQIIARAKKVWPCPPIIPRGWSCAWENWPYLLTFYWLSPYYLMLPQIEMIVNIRHGIPGETRPILFSDERQAFIFTLVDDTTQYFMFDVVTHELRRFEGVHSEKALVKEMDRDYEAVESKLRRVEPDAEGQMALQRILARDESVIPLLADKFLDYTPIPTKPWEEGTAGNVSELSEEEVIEALKELEETEKVMTEQGFDTIGLEDDEEGTSDEEADEDEDDAELDEYLDKLDVEQLEKLVQEQFQEIDAFKK